MKVGHEEQANANGDKTEKFDFVVRRKAASKVVAYPFMKDDDERAGDDDCDAG